MEGTICFFFHSVWRELSVRSSMERQWWRDGAKVAAVLDCAVAERRKEGEKKDQEEGEEETPGRGNSDKQ